LLVAKSTRTVGDASLNGCALVTSSLSRRSFFTGLSGCIGLSGCNSAAQLQSASELERASAFALRLSSVGSVDLNSTAEQTVDILHNAGVRPEFAQVIVVDVIQDDPMVDASALLWAPGYPIYDEAASTNTTARVLVKFAAPAGVPATGRARILFEL
jgi:hypothetical protein